MGSFKDKTHLTQGWAIPPFPSYHLNSWLHQMLDCQQSNKVFVKNLIEKWVRIKWVCAVQEASGRGVPCRGEGQRSRAANRQRGLERPSDSWNFSWHTLLPILRTTLRGLTLGQLDLLCLNYCVCPKVWKWKKDHKSRFVTMHSSFSSNCQTRVCVHLPSAILSYEISNQA